MVPVPTSIAQPQITPAVPGTTSLSVSEYPRLPVLHQQSYMGLYLTLPSAHLCRPPFSTPVSPSLQHTCVTLPSAHLCHPPFGTPVSPSLWHTCVTLPSAHLCHPPFGTPVSPSLRHTCVTLPSAHLCHPPFGTPVSLFLWHICVRAPQNSGQIWNYCSPTAPLCQCIPEHRSYGSSNTGVLGR